jgi:MoaA/NifB/PqqE/SkfB family radical SAM enzyme
MQTSLITNGTLLESKIDEITPYINGGIFVSIDGIGKTHDEIRGVSGCFKKAIEGITAASQRMSITINTTIMAQNIHEIEDLVKLAKELGVKISVAVAHDYGNAQVFAPSSQELAEVAGRLVLLKKMGYPLINSISYLQVMGKKKNWSCKPWSTINVSPEGSLVLPCYVRKEYATSVSTFETSIKSAIADFDWKEIRNCQVCTLHCYVEPSLVLSYDFGTLRNWALPS